MSNHAPKMNIPLHLSLTGRPLALYPAVIPELSHRLQSSYDGRTAKITDRILRREAKQPNPVAANLPTSRIALSDAPQPIRRESYIEVISIEGPLLNKAYMFGSTVCIDGYDRIEAALAEAVNDPACAGVLLDIDSPGGMVSGCFELSDKIGEMAKQKPILAFTSGLLCSAAYAIAAQCTEIHCQMSAMIGSIGVIYGRYDFTAANTKLGLKIDFIKSGEKKTWGHPDTQITDAELAEEQAEIDKLAGWFFDRVSAGRNIDTKTISGLEAGTFLGDDAVTNNLVDANGDFAAALSRLTELVQDPAPSDPAPAPSSTKPQKSVPVAAATPTSTKTKEIPMSNFKSAASRATLTAMLGGLAFAMIGNSPSFASSDVDDEDITEAVETETDEEVEALNDEEVDALNEDDEVDAMDEDEDIEALDEDEVEAEENDEDKEPTALVAASRIANKVMADFTAKAAAKKSAKKASKKSARKNAGGNDRMATAKKILALPAAKGREAHAQTLAFDTDMTVDEAKSALTADKAKTGSGRLSEIHDPNIGAGGQSGGKTASLDQVLKDHQAKNRKRIGQD